MTKSIIGSPGASGPSVTPNTTIPAIPFLSAAATYADSPMFRFDANTIEQRNGINGQTLRVYASWTDAADNHGVRIVCAGALATIESFKNGVDSAPDLAINSNSARLNLQQGGNTKFQITSLGISPLAPILQYVCASGGLPFGTAGAGAAWVASVTDLNNHTDATRTDPLIVIGPNPGAGGSGTYRINLQYQVKTIQAGATMNYSISWVDQNTVTHTRTGSLSLAANGETSAQIIAQCKNSQTVSVITTITTGGTGAYDARLIVEQLE